MDWLSFIQSMRGFLEERKKERKKNNLAVVSQQFWPIHIRCRRISYLFFIYFFISIARVNTVRNAERNAHIFLTVQLDRHCALYLFIFHLGLCRNRALIKQWQCKPGRSALLCPWGSRLWHKLPATITGLCYQPLRAARCSNVWLHQHVCLRDCCFNQGEIWTSATGCIGGR